MDRRVVSLDLGSLSTFGQLAWLSLVELLSEIRREQSVVVVDARRIKPCVQQAIESLRDTPASVALANRDLLPGPEDDFCFVSGSQVLSAKLWEKFDRIHIEPADLPLKIDSRIYLEAVSTRRLHSVLTRWMRQADVRNELESDLKCYLQSVDHSFRRVTLLTSLYEADAYLDGLLRNSEQLEGYVEYEHLLARAASPGAEHASLVAHVRAWPCAVYINLSKDPGLYDVWNLLAQLATAPYLSSSNVDDRRAPRHVAALTSWLDADPSIDVASSGLEILDDDGECADELGDRKFWYADGEPRRYEVNQLIKRTTRGLVSHNIPHCMPVWRRSLHAFHGYFREREFGPSSDWEFWLRAGTAGAGFWLDPDPMGTYLRRNDSYWRRAPLSSDADDRIVGRYGWRMGGLPFKKNVEVERPESLLYGELRALADAGAYAELLGALTKRFRATAAGELEDGSVGVLDAITWHYFGVAKVSAWIADDPLRVVLKTTSTLGGLLQIAIEILHRRSEWDSYSVVPLSRDPLWCACVDLFILLKTPRALIACALLCRRRGDAAAETGLLQEAHRHGSHGFWRALQAVYRFEVPLHEFAARVGSVAVPDDSARVNFSSLNLWFYPDFTESNPYQIQLYEPVVNAGGIVTGVQSYADLMDLRPVEGMNNVLHLHWLHAAFRDATEETFAKRADEFLNVLEQVKGRGFQVYWTIHNDLSHEPIAPYMEADLRRRLCLLADRVYVHHPMVAEELKWLPEEAELRLVEHGRYRPVGADSVSLDKTAARSRLGLDQDAFWLVCVGNLRDYKALDHVIPAIRDVMKENRRLKLAVAGRISSRAARRALKSLPAGQLVVIEGFLSAAEMEIWLRSGDFAFLSYAAILTSGSMFQSFSLGVPVIAPSLGTIPVYVVEGWNGYTYGSLAALRSLLRQRVRDPETLRAALSRNASRTAAALDWRFG